MDDGVVPGFGFQRSSVTATRTVATAASGVAQVGEVSSPDAGPSFRISAASAARWGFISFAGEQFLRLALTVPLARVLGPDNWGILAQAAIYISFTSLFIDQGFGAALIQKKTVVPRDLGSAFWLNIGSATLLAAITVPLAPLVANFFHTPELTSVSWSFRSLSSSVAWASCHERS